MKLAENIAVDQIDPFAEVGPDRMTATIMRRAMASQKVVAFRYDDKERHVEVHAIGRSTKDGSMVMRGYMPGDDRPWRLFTLSKVEGLVIDLMDSAAPREGYAQGDRQMNPVMSEIAL